MPEWLLDFLRAVGLAKPKKTVNVAKAPARRHMQDTLDATARDRVVEVVKRDKEPPKPKTPNERIMDVARRELGVREIPGPDSNPRIIEYWRGIGTFDDETAWCSAFANWVCREAGFEGTGKPNARSWATWGVPVELANIKIGDTLVFYRGDRNGWQGHVGFFAGHDDAGNLLVLGGNQGNSVSIKPYPVSRLLAVRRVSEA